MRKSYRYGRVVSMVILVTREPVPPITLVGRNVEYQLVVFEAWI